MRHCRLNKRRYDANEEQDRFLEYYSNNFPDFILAVATKDHDVIKIVVNTQCLFNEIAEALGRYLQRNRVVEDQNSQQQSICNIQ